MEQQGSEQQDNQQEVVPFKLQKMTGKHKEVLSLIAQGLGRTEVASITGFTPEYVTMLCKQEVCKEYLDGIMAVVDTRLAMMTEQSVDTIADVMKCGGNDDRLKAAKLQLEVTGRIGVGRAVQGGAAVGVDGLTILADRLVQLLRQTKGQQNENENSSIKQTFQTIQGQFTTVQPAR